MATFIFTDVAFNNMGEDKDKDVCTQEFQLDPDAELRFEVENKNETVIIEVSGT